MLRSYLRLLLFACGLLAGVQVPGLMDQYGKRVDAHLRENKASGGDGIPVELFQILKDDAVKVLHSVQFSHSVVSDSLPPHESQHARPPCLSPTPGIHSSYSRFSHVKNLSVFCYFSFILSLFL